VIRAETALLVHRDLLEKMAHLEVLGILEHLVFLGRQVQKEIRDKREIWV
jgi:hypothetical protein